MLTLSVQVNRPAVSWADILQLASAEAVEHMGGDSMISILSPDPVPQCIRQG